ncbi:hypothetical protein GUITHDRAFT_118336 [Guillardia theta CCMP2712]|uniref:Uncharacterized protein n=1 Tax=Guillardia theta (strain CCMP2712) TaxID=905079 RepID=L1IHF5_GUITC|nr:hypothetical protein GUITHDRAFT_118336 [Guillardia theta CCMP2712]EKX35527.1 hypothetical protein GUITHDRAFT_118336 [Guillardia theta CCMP2712]|eukprot:XP_005822507.1 hypothetical protein GUITHDRAFT_118336 [Guillardia theta CCMP2712]
MRAPAGMDMASEPLSKETFDQFFGCSFITAPVTTRHNLIVDFNIGYEADESFQWLDDYESILAFMRTPSHDSEPMQNGPAETEIEENECSNTEQAMESDDSLHAFVSKDGISSPGIEKAGNHSGNQVESSL